MNGCIHVPKVIFFTTYSLLYDLHETTQEELGAHHPSLGGFNTADSCQQHLLLYY